MNFFRGLINAIRFLLVVAAITIAVLYLASIAKAVNGT